MAVASAVCPGRNPGQNPGIAFWGRSGPFSGRGRVGGGDGGGVRSCLGGLLCCRKNGRSESCRDGRMASRVQRGRCGGGVGPRGGAVNRASSLRGAGRSRDSRGWRESARRRLSRWASSWAGAERRHTTTLAASGRRPGLHRADDERRSPDRIWSVAIEVGLQARSAPGWSASRGCTGAEPRRRHAGRSIGRGPAARRELDHGARRVDRGGSPSHRWIASATAVPP
jgi:hypothetical protein